MRIWRVASASASHDQRAPPTTKLLTKLVAEVVRASAREPARALRLAREALDDPGLSPRLRVDVLKAASMARFHEGDADGALQVLQQAVQAAADLGDVDRTARCLNNLGILEWSQGRFGPALQAQQQALTLAGRSSPLAAICLANIGLIAESLGELELALQFTTVAHALLPPGADRAGTALNVGTLSQRLGRHEQAAVFLDEAVALAERTGSTTIEINALAALAWAEAQSGDREPVRHKLESLAHRAGEAGLQLSRWRAQMLVGETLLQDGRAEEAVRVGQACAAALQALRQDTVAIDGLGQWMPQALAASGHWREACEWLLRVPGRTGGGGASLTGVRSALFAIAAEPWAQAAGVTASPRYRAVPAVAARLHLSELDARILCAVVGGQRNAEIAGALGLSAHTVRNRLSAAMRRLGVGSRTAAARRSLELGIVALDTAAAPAP